MLTHGSDRLNQAGGYGEASRRLRCRMLLRVDYWRLTGSSAFGSGIGSHGLEGTRAIRRKSTDAPFGGWIMPPGGAESECPSASSRHQTGGDDDCRRSSALDRAVANELASGAELESQAGMNAVLLKGKKVNHVLHAILSLITAGIWLICVAAARAHQQTPADHPVSE